MKVQDEFAKTLEAVTAWAKEKEACSSEYRKAKEKEACSSEYRKAKESKDFAALLTVVTQNWLWCWAHDFTLDMLMMFPEEVRKEANVIITHAEAISVTEGFVYAYGNSTVRAYGNSTVRAYGNSTVRAYDNSTVRADGNSTVEAYGNSTVEAYGNSTVEAYGNSTVRAYGNSTVRAFTCATINSYNKNGHVVHQFAVCRFISSPAGTMVVEFKMADPLEVITKKPEPATESDSLDFQRASNIIPSQVFASVGEVKVGDETVQIQVGIECRPDHFIGPDHKDYTSPSPLNAKGIANLNA